MKRHTGLLRHCDHCDATSNGNDPRPVGWRVWYVESDDPTEKPKKGKRSGKVWNIHFLCAACNPGNPEKPHIQAKPPAEPKVSAREAKRRAKASKGMFE